MGRNTSVKKSLFGYNIKETDNLFNSMQNHIDVLTGKITNLNAELAAKNNVSVSNEDTERKIAQLQEKINLLEKENSTLKRDLSAARSQIELRQVPAAGSTSKEENIVDSNKKVESIGKIYLAAYEDAEKIKKNAVEEANVYLDRFDSIKKNTKQKMAATLDQIRYQQSHMEDVLNETVQNIVKALGDFGIQSDLMLNKIEELEKSVAVKIQMPEELNSKE